MIILFSLIALFIAWIWVDYFLQIDIFERESWKTIALSFFLGCTSYFFAFLIQQILPDYPQLSIDGSWPNDLVYYSIKIGFIEELAKLIPVALIYYTIHKNYKEPLDFIIYICISAIGFSAVENLVVFMKEGPIAISHQAVVGTLIHIISSSVIAYGIIDRRYRKEKLKNFGHLLLCILAAGTVHGLYNFWSTFKLAEGSGWLLAIVYFLFLISFFATAVNNALNYSRYFTYKKTINPQKVSKRILSCYAVIIVLALILVPLLRDYYPVQNPIGSAFAMFIVVSIAAVRLSRLKLIRLRWNRLRLELPITFSKKEHYSDEEMNFPVHIRGESLEEGSLSQYYHDYFLLNSIAGGSTYFGNIHAGYVVEKLFLLNDRTYYLAKIYYDGKSGDYIEVLLRPRTKYTTSAYGRYPIVAVLKWENSDDTYLPNAQSSFTFLEWAFVSPFRED